MTFQKLNIQELQMNTFTSIGKDWMLITAGHQEKVNTMTASWGGMGVLWGQDVVTAYIRPQRYTKQFVDQEKYFSISFFEGHKKELGLLGRVSGRDTDKIKDADFHITYLENVPTFQEAKLVFIVEKIYADTIKPNCFLDSSLDETWYPDKDYHTMYVAKIKSIYIQQP